MNSKELQQARKYEETYGGKIREEERPLFHVSPKVGWLNDPNGFSYYKGEYHLFYQYHPYDTNWGPMHWGHVTTKDFIKWNWLPAVMAPDEDYDYAGCFSGSAVELPDGRHCLMYTGVTEWKDEEDRKIIRQHQCMAYGNGLDYEKYEGNPVITGADLPEGASLEDFRDPKIWYDKEENCYYSVVGSRPADGSGSILLYRSEDTEKWEFVTVLDSCKNQYGLMWECPDFFPLDGYYIALTSPQSMRARGMEFHNGNGNIYLIGSYDKKNHEFKRSEVRAIDYGLDFYAPQTVETPDGRRIMIGWMQSWESSKIQPQGAKWFGMMTLPRELSVKDGKLIQTPVRELENYLSDPVIYRDVDVEDCIQLPDVKGRAVDLEVTVRPSGTEMYQKFTIKVAMDSENYTAISYNPANSVLKIDRTNSGFRNDIICVRKLHVRSRNGVLKMRIIMDRNSIEIFVNDGEQTVTSTIYTPVSADRISFESVGMAIVDVMKRDIVIE